MSDAQKSLERGDRFPYDSTDAWQETNDPAPPSVDWAHRAARGVIADLTDRRGIKHEFSNVDEDIRVHIVFSLAEIIRAAHPSAEEVAKDAERYRKLKAALNPSTKVTCLVDIRDQLILEGEYLDAAIDALDAKGG